ncbi:MAG: glycosyltransferase family 4 protein [Rhodobacter sp.]|nr:glycosyltransferase family 4 protein [Rhodobacter sp.]
MRIVQLCPYAMDRPGGVQRHVRDLSDWLVTQGHDVRIIAPPAPGQPARREGLLIELGRSRAISVHGTAFEISRASRHQRRAAVAELGQWQADLVHMHTPWTPMLVWQVWRALRLPSVTTIHATLPAEQGKSLTDRYIRCAARHFLRHSKAVIVPSEAPLPMLRALVPGQDAHVLPPAVDLSGWRTAPRPQRAGLSLMFLGRLEARKGVDVLLNAWEICAPALPGATLTIAGDGALRPQVEAAQSPRLIYAGRLDDTTARHLLAGTDMFVAPAPYGESYGLVLAEAMAAGAIPVAAANAGYASVLGPDLADLLVAPGDAAALAAKIIELATDRDRLVRLRDTVRSRSMNSDIAQVGPRYAALYSGLLA